MVKLPFRILDHATQHNTGGKPPDYDYTRDAYNTCISVVDCVRMLPQDL